MEYFWLPWWIEMAISCRERRLVLQEHDLKWLFLPTVSTACSLHWQCHIFALGKYHLGLDGGVGLIDNMYNVYDGTDELLNCSAVDHHQWTYNVGAFLYGAAVLQNYTNSSQIWMDRTLGLLDSVNSFVTPFKNSTNMIFEAECELKQTCNIDQLSMKAFLVRWLAGTSLMAPFTAGRVGELLRTSAKGAAASCTGGRFGTTCGSKWYINGWDGTSGLGQQLSAMEVMYALLVNQTDPPANALTVTIQPAPSVSFSATASSQPSDTSRPLHDGVGPRINERVRQKVLILSTFLILLEIC